MSEAKRFEHTTRAQLINIILELEHAVVDQWIELNDEAFDGRQKIFVTHEGSVNVCHWVKAIDQFSYNGGAWPKDKVYGYVELPKFTKHTRATPTTSIKGETLNG